jgi:hypothetical protein
LATRASHSCPHAGHRQRARSSPEGARSVAVIFGRPTAATNWSAITGYSDAKVRGRQDDRSFRHRRSPRARASLRFSTVGIRIRIDGAYAARASTTPKDHCHGSPSSSQPRTTCCSSRESPVGRRPMPRGRIRTYRSPASRSSFRASRAVPPTDPCHLDGSRSTSRSASCIQRSTRSSAARLSRASSAPTVTVRPVVHRTSSATSNSNRLDHRPPRQVGHCVPCLNLCFADVSHS